ncbi:MAG: hypothetical protein WBP79_11270 [Candidatus Acidiferrales bacterium]
MRLIARSCLVAFLVAGLVNLPALAANEKALGLVIQAQSARLGGANAVVGATVYPGDALATEVGGTLRMKIGSGQIYLLSASGVILAENADAVQATVTHGTVGFSTSSSDRLDLLIPEGIVRAFNGQPAYGQVAIVSPTEVVISAYRGALVLDNDGELHTIGAGSSYRVTMVPDAAPQAPAGAGTKESPSRSSPDSNVVHTKRRHLVFALMVLGAMGIASYFIYDKLSESSYKLSN